MTIIRQETPCDFAPIYDLVKTAFETARYAEGDEQDFVERQRHPDTYVPELALVAEDDGAIIAHIMLTRTFVSMPEGRFPILLLAALAVAVERRSQGIGTRLVEAAILRARTLGYNAIILVGDPAYYARFGFRSSTAFAITSANPIEDEYVQIRELVPGALKNVSGSVALPK
jgi:putative acetyltransferase